MADMVVMEHPKIEGQTSTVPRRAFERVWKGKGWTLVDEGKSAGEVKAAAKTTRPTNPLSTDDEETNK